MDSASAGAEGGGSAADAVTTTATCACCGMDEECTPRYVARVAAQFGGAWVCGLCAEAIKDEAVRRGVGLEAARRAHAEFVASAAAGAGSGSGPAVQVVRALLQLLKKVIAASAALGAAVVPQPATPPAPHEMHVAGNNHDLISLESCM